MTYRTVESVLNPDGRLAPPSEELPEHPVRVMVMILEREDEEGILAEPGDDRLARGEIRWQ